MRAYLVVAGTLCGLFAGGMAHGANLIHDGGFELPVIPAGKPGVYYPNDAKISQWTVVGATGNVELVSGSLMADGFTFNAKGGAQWLDLTGNTQTATGVAETFATTSGSTYTLKFSVGSVYDATGNLGTTSTVFVLNGSTQIFEAVADGDPNAPSTKSMKWKTFSVAFTATAPTTTLSFINGDPSTDSVCGLDDVSVASAAAAKPAILGNLHAH